ncbi:MAG: phosphate signaling complex protein PhoU [Lachnospiraceae bacterium]
MRSRFERQLEQLHQEMIQMGHMIEQAIEMAMQALVNKDVEVAKTAMDFDEEVNHQEKIIENLCFQLLSLQQPVAKDLRTVSAALKMVTDMERIGDQAQDISELSIQLSKSTCMKTPLQIEKMAKESTEMVILSLEAFVEGDRLKAEEIIGRDDRVDQLFLEVKTLVIALIRENNEQGELAADYLMVAKYFERIADHATNIAEWVIYSITGSKEDLGD